MWHWSADTLFSIMTAVDDHNMHVHLIVSQTRYVYSYFEKGCRKKYARDHIPKGNMGYDQYAVPDIVSVKSSIVVFL